MFSYFSSIQQNTFRRQSGNTHLTTCIHSETGPTTAALSPKQEIDIFATLMNNVVQLFWFEAEKQLQDEQTMHLQDEGHG